MKAINKFLNDLNKMTDGMKIAFLYDNIDQYHNSNEFERLPWTMVYNRVDDNIKNFIDGTIINRQNKYNKGAK